MCTTGTQRHRTHLPCTMISNPVSHESPPCAVLPQRLIELNGHSLAQTSKKEASRALPAYEHERARRLNDVADFLRQAPLPERKFIGPMT